MNLKRFIGYLPLPPHFLEEMKNRQFIIVDLSSHLHYPLYKSLQDILKIPKQGCRQYSLKTGKTVRLFRSKTPERLCGEDAPKVKHEPLYGPGGAARLTDGWEGGVFPWRSHQVVWGFLGIAQQNESGIVIYLRVPRYLIPNQQLTTLVEERWC